MTVAEVVWRGCLEAELEEGAKSGWAAGSSRVKVLPWLGASLAA